jgi:hypothetical protein
MPDAPVPPLLVYPELWQQSRERYPHDWQWPDQLRHLCALARAFRRQHRAEVGACGEGERLFLQSLAQIDVEDFIVTLRSDFPNESNPMLRIDPSDPYVDRSQYPSLYPTMNGKRYRA